MQIGYGQTQKIEVRYDNSPSSGQDCALNPLIHISLSIMMSTRYWGRFFLLRAKYDLPIIIFRGSQWEGKNNSLAKSNQTFPNIQAGAETDIIPRCPVASVYCSVNLCGSVLFSPTQESMLTGQEHKSRGCRKG